MQSLDGGQPGTACFLSLKDLGLPPGPGACVSSGGQGWPSLQHGTLSEAARGREPKGGSNPQTTPRALSVHHSRLLVLSCAPRSPFLGARTDFPGAPA